MSKRNKIENENSAMQFILDMLEQDQVMKKDKSPKYVINDELKVTDNLSIVKRIVQGPVLICFWSDGTKTKSKSMIPENFDYQVGLTVCICKKLLGEKNYYNLIDEKPYRKLIDKQVDVYEKDAATKEDATYGKNKSNCKKCTCCENKFEDEDMSDEEAIEAFFELLGLLSLLGEDEE